MNRHDVDAWTPLGRALADVHAGDLGATLYVRSDLWEDESVPATDYYRPLTVPLPDLERRALAACRGRVLDAGAGAGRHALELQRTGLEVVAVDISPDAVAVMRDRGVRDARVGDVFDLAGERFDTVLMLMHGLGVVGTLANLDRFLRQLVGLLAADGQLIADSADLAAAVDDLAVEDFTHAAYPGEVEFQVTYRGLDGRAYPWLFVDPGTLAEAADAAGLTCDVLARGARGSYLARLTRRTTPARSRHRSSSCQPG